MKRLRELFFGGDKWCALVVCGLLLAVPWPAAGAEERYAFAYEILLAGFPVGEIEVSAVLSEEDYYLSVDARNTGVLRLLAGFESRAETRGTGVFGKLRPRSHRADTVWVGERRHVRAIYDDDGSVTAQVSPTAEADGREEVPQGSRRDTVDPLTAALAASLRVGGPLACQDRISVFDGRRRYNLTFNDAGRDRIEGPLYEGFSTHCRVRLERIAGFSRNPWLPRAEMPEAADIWFAQVTADGPTMPVRFQADLGLGSVEINMVSYAAGPVKSRASGDGARIAVTPADSTED